MPTLANMPTTKYADLAAEMLHTLKFVLDDLNTELDYETRLIILAVIAKAE